MFVYRTLLVNQRSRDREKKFVIYYLKGFYGLIF